jgi:hypothetical protein
MAECVQIEERIGHYVYILDKQGKPLRLHMLGPEIAMDAHFDEYILDFKSFEALDDGDDEPFEVPEACRNATSSGSTPVSLALASLIPHGRVSL